MRSGGALVLVGLLFGRSAGDCVFQNDTDYDSSDTSQPHPAAADPQACCALCTANSSICDVAVWAPPYRHSGAQCYFKKGPNPKPNYKGGVTACWPAGHPIPPPVPSPPPPTPPTPAGNLPTSVDEYQLEGFNCSDGNFSAGSVRIYYPTPLNDTYPVVSMLHGSGGTILGELCESIASLGIVVVAPERGVCGDWSLQQRHAVQGSQANTSLHPALPHVDFSKIGIIGHSEGAAFTMGTAADHQDASFKVSAMVVSHGASGNAAPGEPAGLPSMYVTGSSDPRRRFVSGAFNAVPSVPRVFAELSGGPHMEPAHAGRLNAFDAHFLGCYLIPRQASCDLIYGNSTDSLCNKHPMSACTIKTS